MSLLYAEDKSVEDIDCSVCNNSLCWSDQQYIQYQYYTQVGILTAVFVTIAFVGVSSIIISRHIIQNTYVGIFTAVFLTIACAGVTNGIISISIIQR